MGTLILALWLAVPTAGWQRAATVPVTAKSYVRLQVGDATILYNGLIAPGELRLFISAAVAPAPPPAPPQPPLWPPGPPPPGWPDAMTLTGVTSATGQPLGVRFEGYQRIVLGAAKIGEEVTLAGRLFGSRPGLITLGSIRQTVVEWTDTRIVFRVVDPGYAEANLALRLPDGRHLTQSGFLAERGP